MRSIEILREEHRLARTLLACLEALAEEARLDDRVDREEATRILRIFERFLDWSHQDKEEEVLFPLLCSRADRATAGHLARLFQEHAEERRRLIGMSLHLEGAARGDLVRVARFVDHARAYVRHQVHHLEKEERDVLPLAERVLGRGDDRLLLEGFAAVERRLGGVRGLRSKVRGLCRRFRVPWRPPEAPAVA